MKKTRVVFYARVSKDTEEQLHSFEAQKKYFEEFISRNKDMVFIRGYADEGISGVNVKKRKQFQQMIEDAKNSEFDLILTKEVTRFARNTVDTLVNTRLLLKYNVGVLFTTDNIDTRSNDGELRLSLMATLAQEESRKISSRVNWATKRNYENGVAHGTMPYGYKRENGKIVIVEDEAKVVQQIFRLYIDGYGTRRIANTLNEQGYYNATGGEWLPSTIRGMLKNRKYCGDLVQGMSKTIDFLEKKREELVTEIEEGNQKLSDKQAELEKLGEQAIEQKKQEIESLVSENRKELEDVQIAIEKAKKEAKQFEADRDTWKRACDSIKDEYRTVSNDLNTKIIEWAANNRTSEITKLLVSQLEMPEETVEENVLSRMINLKKDVDADEIVAILCKKFEEAGRVISKDDAYNYLISIVQNYITVFAGEPGTGKTSLCKLLAKALGLYDSRFAEILVERGWTSSKDLVGYYNPLTKEIESTQPRFSECMKKLNEENANNIVEAPYLVLLDEANLSPIEFYWSNFNYYCDDPTHQVVSYSNGEKYEFGSELKFLATINYDQTTADLSPRFLDRAWVISMNPVSVDVIVSGLMDDSVVENNSEVISLETLNNIFDWHNVKDKKMNQITKTRLDRIIDKMKEGGHTISARSIHLISHYYLVAEMFMSSKEVALDYAISQKILPCINGNGKQYKEFLNGLMTICKENQLNKSASIVSKILEKSEHEFYSFFSL